MSLKGFLIGNGYISQIWDAKTMLDFYYFHGLMGRETYKKVRDTCCKDDYGDVCDLSKSMYDEGTCQSLIDEAFDVNIDPYNIYQQCYENTVSVFGSAAPKYHAQFKDDLHKIKLNLNQAIKHRLQGNTVLSAVFTQQSKLNYGSTDQNGGFMCYMSSKLEDYLNQWHVRDALHIPDFVQPFQFCRQVLFNNYIDV